MRLGFSTPSSPPDIPRTHVAAVGRHHSGTGRATFTPSLQGDTAQQRHIYSNFCYVYGDHPSATRTKLALLVRVVEGLSWLRYGQAFPDLSPERRGALYRTITDVPIGRLQTGFGRGAVARLERHLYGAGDVGVDRLRRADCRA